MVGGEGRRTAAAPLGGEGAAQAAQDAPLVRRAVEVDAWVGAGLGLEET